MKNFLENLRQKNEAQKMTIAFACAIIFTFVLVSSWLAWNSFSSEKKAEAEVKSASSNEVTPVSNIKSQFSEVKSMFGEFMVQFNESKEILNAMPDFSEENSIYEDFSGQNQVLDDENTENIEEIPEENSTTSLEIESSAE